MNKLKMRRFKDKVSSNKYKFSILILILFIFFISVGYSALNMQLGIDGTVGIDYTVPREIDKCPFDASKVSVTYTVGSVYGSSPTNYEVNLTIHNETGQTINNFEMYIYGPSDLNVGQSAFFTDMSIDNGEVILTPQSWCSSIGSNDVSYSLHFETVETNFVPYSIKLNDCTIYGESGSGSGSTEITSISINPSEVNMLVGDSQNMAVQTFPNGIPTTLSWSSSNNSVATVNENGLVSAVGVGNAIIIATNGRKSATCNVKVMQPQPNIPTLTGITLNRNTASIEAYETLQLSYTRNPSNAILETITWNSSDTSIATVDGSGLVTALKPGVATITASSGNISDSCVLTVTQSSLELLSLSLNTNNLEMEIDEKVGLILTKTPENAINQITWSSSDKTVATVNSSGLITAKNPGTATITAKSGNISASCRVTVKSPSTDNIQVTFAPGDWYGGTALQFKITINNNSSKAINNIRISVDLPENSSFSFWHGPEVSNNGNVITWTQTIAVNGKTEIRGQITLPNGYNANDYINAGTTIISLK